MLAGSKTYEQNIAGCNGRLATVGQYFPTDAAAMSGPTVDGFTDLIALDPGASWNAGTNTVQGSCAPACASISPRLVAIALFDVDVYQFMRSNNNWGSCPTRCVRVVNIVGFFLGSVSGGDATGYLTKYPGLVSPPPAPGLSAASSFLPAITLVR